MASGTAGACARVGATRWMPKPAPPLASRPDTTVALLNRLLFALTLSAPRWTREMCELQARVEAHIAQLEALPASVQLAHEAQAEVRLKVLRFDRLRALAQAGNPRRCGFTVGEKVYDSFESAFDAHLEEAQRQVEREAGEAGEGERDSAPA